MEKYSNYKSITPESVKKLSSPTDTFLCPLNANHYLIQFLNFKIRETDTDKTFFEIQREPSDNFEAEINTPIPPEQEELIRTVRYNFSKDFFALKNVGKILYK